MSGYKVQAVRWGMLRHEVLAESASAAAAGIRECVRYVAHGGTVYIDAPDGTSTMITRAYK